MDLEATHQLLGEIDEYMDEEMDAGRRLGIEAKLAVIVEKIRDLHLEVVP